MIPRPAVTDAQLVTLAEIEATFHHPDGYTRTEGASQAGLRARTVQHLLNDGLVVRTDTGDPDTDGGRYRLHLTEQGLEQIRRGVTHRLLVLPWLPRVEAEGALF